MIPTIFRSKINLPDLSTFLFMFILVSVLLVIFRFSDTRLAVENLLNINSPQTIQETIAAANDNGRSESTEPSKTEKQMMTIFIWFIAGCVVYIIGYGSFATIIKPIYAFHRTSEYVHSDKKSLIKEKFQEFLVFAFAVIFIILALIFFRFPLITYYTQMLDGLNVREVVYFLVSMVVTIICTAGAHMFTRASFRVYE